MRRPGKSLCVTGNKPTRDIWMQSDEALQNRMLKPREERLRCKVCLEYVEKMPTAEKPCKVCGDW